MANDFLHELAEQAGIETGLPVKDKPADLSKHAFEVDPAGRFVCTWKTDGIRMIAEACERKPLELWILLTVQLKPDDSMPHALMTKKRLNLRSLSGSREVVSYLNAQMKRDWSGRLEILSGHVDKNFSAGDPMVWLDEVKDPGSVTYLADPLLELNEHNIIFADGSSTKSFLALALCMSYAAGKSFVPGVGVAAKGKSLYLDWETSKESQRRRFQRFAANTKGVAYKRMSAPLMDVGDELRQLILQHNFGLVVCDSASMASGGEIIDESAVARFFLVCRSFNTTLLTLAHVPKHGDRERPIGSTYWYNQCRVAWELIKEQVEGDSVARLDLIQRKSNNDQTHKPFGLELDFGGTQTVYRHAEAGMADAERLPLATRIKHFLLEKGKATTAEIAEELGKTPVRIANLLRSQEGKMFATDNAKKDRLWWVLPSPIFTTKDTSKFSGDTPPFRGEGDPRTSEHLPLKMPKVDTERVKAEDDGGDIPW